jgi:hypothetical protein
VSQDLGALGFPVLGKRWKNRNMSPRRPAASLIKSGHQKLIGLSHKQIEWLTGSEPWLGEEEIHIMAKYGNGENARHFGNNVQCVFKTSAMNTMP